MVLTSGGHEIVGAGVSPYASEAEAEALEGVGAYSWMTSRLYGTDRVLEIGSGTGRGTLAMVVEGMRVVAVEKNPDAVRAALVVLRAHGISAESTMDVATAME